MRTFARGKRENFLVPYSLQAHSKKSAKIETYQSTPVSAFGQSRGIYFIMVMALVSANPCQEPHG